MHSILILIDLSILPLQQFKCNGTVIENAEYGEVIQLQGDQRVNVRDFLQAIELAKPEQLNVHGF